MKRNLKEFLYKCGKCGRKTETLYIRMGKVWQCEECYYKKEEQNKEGAKII